MDVASESVLVIFLITIMPPLRPSKKELIFQLEERLFNPEWTVEFAFIKYAVGGPPIWYHIFLYLALSE